MAASFELAFFVGPGKAQIRRDDSAVKRREATRLGGLKFLMGESAWRGARHILCTNVISEPVLLDFLEEVVPQDFESQMFPASPRSP